MDDDKVKPISPNISQIKDPAQTAKELRGILTSAHIEFLVACAEYDYQRFQAYKRAGFSDQQALFLTRRDG